MIKGRIEARMQYYHVHVDRDGDETEETDFTKEKSIEHVVKPYDLRKKFLWGGAIIDPSEITTIRIVETAYSSSSFSDLAALRNDFLSIGGAERLG